jgi:hypothetical protein
MLELYFPQFMAFFSPPAFAEIDWSRGHAFLDQELQQVVRDAATGGRRVDKLVKVFLLDGAETWLLIHVEVQGQSEEEFPERMFIYHYRIYDHYRRPVVSLAVLTDESRGWRPSHFGYSRWGCQLALDFPIVKLLDYEQRQDALAEDADPFALVVLAHLQTQATRRDPEGRYAAKLSLARHLYRRGYGRREILELFRFVDWVMTLPEGLDRQFKVELAQIEEESHMRYITSVERIARQEGLEEGLEEGRQEGVRQSILAALRLRFGAPPADLVERLERLDDAGRLSELYERAILADSLAAFSAFLPGDGAG